ncbi:hypothetical protein ACF0H5_007150 [Mactra antiquata]
MTYDDILHDVGELGPFQKRIYFLLCLPCFTLSPLLVLQVFSLGTPKHRCKLPNYGNDTYELQGTFHEELVKSWVPADTSGDYDYDRCKLYKTDHMIYNTSDTESCSQWVYDESVFKSTFTTKDDLVCDDAIKIPNVQMVFFFGVLSGSIIYGQISDLIGRKKTLYMCILLMIGSSLGLIPMENYYGFAVLMFILGGSLLGVYMTSYVLGMELVGTSKRFLAGTINTFFLTTGQLYMVLMVYLLRDDKYFTLSVALPGVLFLPYYWLIPESCRWLISKGRTDEAIVILRKVANSNNTKLDEDAVRRLPPPEKQAGVWKLFSTRTLGVWTVIIFFNWFVCSMSYYGVVLNTGNLGGDIYFNFTMLVLAEYPGKFFDLVLLDRIGRKRLYIAYLFIGAAAFLLTIWPIADGGDDLHYVLIALAMIGKLCITGAFGAIYVLSAEIFPTVVRNTGMGASSAVARVGSMLAPYIAKSADTVSGPVGKAIPLSVFGAVMLIAGVLTLILPETLRKDLPESIPDVENLKKKTSSATKATKEAATNDGYDNVEENSKL